MTMIFTKLITNASRLGGKGTRTSCILKSLSRCVNERGLRAGTDMVQLWELRRVGRLPRVAKAQPWAEISERFQRYSDRNAPCCGAPLPKHYQI